MAYSQMGGSPVAAAPTANGQPPGSCTRQLHKQRAGSDAKASPFFALASIRFNVGKVRYDGAFFGAIVLPLGCRIGA